jgi:hypothetical protein
MYWNAYCSRGRAIITKHITLTKGVSFSDTMIKVNKKLENNKVYLDFLELKKISNKVFNSKQDYIYTYNCLI